MTRKAKIFSLFLLIFLLGWIDFSAAQPSGPKVQVAYTSASAVFLPYWIAKEKDLYGRHGIDAELIYITGGSRAIQALIAGNVQVAGVGTGSIEANIQGGGTLYLASFVNHFIFSLYGDPSINNPGELKGSKIGVTRFGTATEYAAKLALRRYGLEPNKDVTIIQTGGVPDTVAAIKSGGVKAGIVSPPMTERARRLGLKEIINITALKLPFIQAGTVVTESYARDNKESIKKLLRALVEAIAIIKTDKPFAKAVIGRYTGLTDDGLLEETYSAFSNEFPRTPYTSVEALRNMVGIIGEIQKRNIPGSAERFADNSFLREIEQEGFVNKLYANQK